MHFHQLKFVLVCAQSKKNLLHNAVFTILRRPCRVKINVSKLYHGPLAGSQHRKSMVSK
jgi:hypothetical protein